MTINEAQDELIEEFSSFEDWMDKYDYLIQISEDLKPLSNEHKTEDNLIEGCQSKVWLHVELNEDKITYLADSDAIITKGLVTMLIRVLSGRTPKEIVESDLYFIDKIGFKENLSPTRSNGLLAMMKKMRLFAIAYNAKLNQ